ncbi:MAG: hypothetical protein HY290_10955 [Planctomycetia bacterium]|nr:hypothetical protein [Planctomycetia bacterium]
MRSTTIGFLFAVLVALLNSGCGDKGAPAGGQALVVSGAVPDNPGDPAQAAVTALIAGLRQGHPEAFWEFLPSDFQEDLNGLVRLFAARMDPELWDKSVSVHRKFAKMLRSQKQFLDPRAQVESRPADAQARSEAVAPATSDGAALADLLESLLDSDAASLERLQKTDGGRLLATAGGKFIDQLRALSRLTPDDEFAFFFDRLADLRVSTVRATKDRARLKFDAPGGTPAIVDFVLHQGKWIPEDLENEWQHGVGNARAWLSTAFNPESIAERKPELLAILGTADAALDKMAAAAAPEEFAVAGQEASRALWVLWNSLSGEAPVVEPSVKESQPVERNELVTIVVSGELDEDSQNALRGRIKSVVDDPDRAAAEITGDDEASTFRVGPVGDVAAFAARLDFLEVTAVDEKTRTIQAKPRK